MGERMKTPEEIKKGLECCTPRWVANHWKSCSGKCPYITLSASCRGQLVYDALAYIQQLEDRIRDLTKLVPKWISVEERLPEEVMRDDSDVSSSDLVIVAVCDDMDNIFVADDIVCEGEWVNYPAPLFEVTHWMPLPELPKEG